MSKKNIFKIILDTLMIITLTLMYQKRAISMSFHEIGGLALLGVFLIHVLLNGQWVVSVTARLLRPGVPFKTRLGWVVDALLLVSFVLIGVSGAFISKVVFSIEGGNAWKTVHYFCAALSIVLMGVHLGLHASFAGKMYRRILHLPEKAGKLLAIVLSVIFIGFGLYSMPTSSFSRWIAMPFSASGAGEGRLDGSGMGKGNGEGRQHQAKQAEEEAAGDTQTDEAMPDFVLPSDGEMPEGMQDRGEGMTEQVNIGNALLVIAQFFSMCYVFAAVTWLVDRLFRGRRKKRSPTTDAQASPTIE